jgi:hypothetical protein
VIVWSRGLGKLRLPIELPAATLHVKPDMLTMEGVIEPVCWRYAIRLGPADLADFLKILATPEAAQFLAERGGLLLPFIGKLLLRVPRVIMSLLFARQTLQRGS